MNEYKAAENIE